MAINYVPLAGVLYKRAPDGVLLRCIGPKEAMLIMAEMRGWLELTNLEKNEVANSQVFSLLAEDGERLCKLC